MHGFLTAPSFEKPPGPPLKTRISGTHAKDHCLSDTTKDEKWLVLVGRPSLAALRWRARRPAPLDISYFSYNDFDRRHQSIGSLID
jgi:hypothetical protein